MSRLGAKPVDIPAGVTVRVDGQKVAAKGPKGELSWTCAAGITAAVDGKQVIVRRASDAEGLSAQHGTTRSLIAGMIRGVHEGYVKELDIEGVGFRALIQGQKIVLNIGYSHPIEYVVPAGLKAEVADGIHIKISGCDKHLVGEVSSQIRNFYRAEPYKGKGIRYKGEHVRRKAGKTVA